LNMFDKEKIKLFVQETLGCGCPGEVFKNIDCLSNVKIDHSALKNKINIGNRLLIYIVELKSLEDLKQMPSLVEAGIKERDLEFNRFRLVLVTENINRIKQAADALFKEIDKDDRVHLHIIATKDIPAW
jgi:hypothetical protein